jgi:hypothetical protein
MEFLLERIIMLNILKKIVADKFLMKIFLMNPFWGKFLENQNDFSSPDGSKYPTLLGVDTANSGRKCFYGNEMKCS